MKIKNTLIIIALYSVDLFFCFANMLITPELTSVLLKIMSAGMAVIIGIIFVKKCGNISKMGALLLFFQFIILLLFFVTFSIYGDNSLARSTFQCFVCYAIPMTMLAILYVKKDYIEETYKYVDVIQILFDVYLIYIIWNGLLAGIKVRELQEVSHIGYQSTSYYGAFAFGVSLYAILFTYRFSKNKITCTARFLFRLVTMILGSIITIYGSGKGAFVLLFAFGLVLVFFYLKQKKSLEAYLLILSAVGVGAIILSIFIERSEALQSSMERILALLGTAGEINYYTTSGRTVIYEKCLRAFLDSPVIGHGISSAPYIGVGQPHQMFLEIMVEGGIVYFVIWIVVLTVAAKRWFWLLKNDSKNMAGYMLLLVIFLGQFICLQFSGIYLQTYSFWFFIAFVYLQYEKQLNKRKN